MSKKVGQRPNQKIIIYQILVSKISFHFFERAERDMKTTKHYKLLIDIISDHAYFMTFQIGDCTYSL